MIQPLDLLWELPALPAFDLPDELARLYPGTFGFEAPRLFANFVETLDGVVAIPSIPNSNKLVAAASEADRFVMGLLRAAADAVVVGSGTLSAAPKSLWTAAQAYPDTADAFAALRDGLGLAPAAQVVVLSASGLVDPAHPVFAAGALVLTSDEGAARLAGRLPEAAEAVSLGAGPLLDVGLGMTLLRERGHRLILTEGGPHVIGSLLADGLVDDLFLTLSPLVAGRHPADPRLALVEGVDLVADGPRAGRLTGVRRDVDHLFLRYDLAPVA